jgi:Flp pilus assembly protein TadD
VFYAKAWVLVHYLALGDGGSRRTQFEAFIRQVSLGANPVAAFRSIFQLDDNALELALRRYVEYDDYENGVVTFPAATPVDPMTVPARTLGEGEVQAHLGTLLVRAGQFDDAEPYLRRAAGLAPALPPPHEALGFAARLRQRPDEAIGHFGNAVARGSRSSLAHYHYADMLLRETMKREVQIDQKTAIAVLEAARRAVQLQPDDADAHHLVAFAQLVTGRDLDEGTAMARSALALDPANPRFMLTLARIHMKRTDYAGARGIVAPLLTATNVPPDVRSQVEGLVADIERLTKPIPTPVPQVDRPPFD